MKLKEQQNKTLLKGMDCQSIKGWCEDNDQSPYRANQIYQWMYRYGLSDASKMSNLSKELRTLIESQCALNTLEVEKISVSSCKMTQKILFKTSDGKFIEAVSMLDGKHHTICLSSQIGCNVNCDFCATASMGLIRNLQTGEIVDQAIYIRDMIKEPITNVVFMGMGEPFLNYERVLRAADILHDPNGFDLGAKRITISTSGIVPKIDQFFKENRKYKLAISLNATNDRTREKIMPVNRKWPIKDIIRSASQFSSRKNYNVMFEYVLLKDINDSTDDARRLASLVKGLDCKINIIPYNETDGQYQRPPKETIESFLRTLNKYRKDFRILVRWSKGEDIEAACGQLAVTH